MNKILKYLADRGIDYALVRSYSDKHYNGRSFYNDGIYLVNVYSLGNNYEIHHKISGRPHFWLYKDSKLVAGAGSQKQFIDFILEVNLKDESLGKNKTE